MRPQKIILLQGGGGGTPRVERGSWAGHETPLKGYFQKNSETIKIYDLGGRKAQNRRKTVMQNFTFCD